MQITDEVIDREAAPSRAIPAPAPVVPASVKSRIVSLYALLIGFNVGAWVWALMAFHKHPVLLGTAFLAWSPPVLSWHELSVPVLLETNKPTPAPPPVAPTALRHQTAGGQP